MGLMSPQFTSLNTRKSKKRKFKSADQKRQYLEEVVATEKERREARAELRERSMRTTYTPNEPYRRSTPAYGSLDTSRGSIAGKKDSPVYTGDKLVGIGTLHKSNMVPIFNDTEAKDIAKMRR